ncbi:hypothetical protein F4820DRAFT_85733 [Hypoxylon rubiginosum]|uniref:Uncharacterized protein n=1 Tax=Hypoxylon rubiginosum TaxID=110542 RepID=A0ACB9YP85_9PEZI|nr:hypothetical protein F4820DRAFT_85733 [Hypoxylon rubiginosum]
MIPLGLGWRNIFSHYHGVAFLRATIATTAAALPPLDSCLLARPYHRYVQVPREGCGGALYISGYINLSLFSDFPLRFYRNRADNKGANCKEKPRKTSSIK